MPNKVYKAAGHAKEDINQEIQTRHDLQTIFLGTTKCPDLSYFFQDGFLESLLPAGGRLRGDCARLPRGRARARHHIGPGGGSGQESYELHLLRLVRCRSRQ